MALHHVHALPPQHVEMPILLKSSPRALYAGIFWTDRPTKPLETRRTAGSKPLASRRIRRPLPA